MAAVIDASVVVRGLTEGGPAALHVEDVAVGRSEGSVPDFFYAEVVSALLKYVRAGQRTPDQARALLRFVTDLPLESTSCADLAEDALGIAVERRVSGYDAMYLALAEATDSVLVTADRRLAAASANAELLED